MKSILTYLKDLFDYKKDERVEAHLNELAKADNLLQSLIKEKKIPGLAITVLKKGESIFQKGYGYANLESKIEIDPESTIFRIASISKNIAATALAIMVKEEIIDLNTSFYNYVPYFPKKKHDFTIRQLAGHTAGIRGYQGKEYALNKPYSIKDSLEIFKNDDIYFEGTFAVITLNENEALKSIYIGEGEKLIFKDEILNVNENKSSYKEF